MMKMYYGGGWEGHGSLMGGSSFLCAVIGLVIFIDLALLGFWLWQKIRKEEHDHHHHSH